MVNFENLFLGQFSTKMNQILMGGAWTPKKLKKIIGLPNIPKNIVKEAKNLLGVLWQDESGVKKKSSRKTVNILENALLVTTPPNTKKTRFYSEKRNVKYFSWIFEHLQIANI